MPRFKSYNYNQSMMVPVNLEDQITEGTLEFAIHYLIDHEMDLSIFDEKFINDETGCPAYDPKILLKIILFYSDIPEAFFLQDSWKEPAEKI